MGLSDLFYAGMCVVSTYGLPQLSTFQIQTTMNKPLCFSLCGSGLSTLGQLLADCNYADLLHSIPFFEAQACGPNAGEHGSFDWWATAMPPTVRV